MNYLPIGSDPGQNHQCRATVAHSLFVTKSRSRVAFGACMLVCTRAHASHIRIPRVCRFEPEPKNLEGRQRESVSCLLPFPWQQGDSGWLAGGRVGGQTDVRRVFGIRIRLSLPARGGGVAGSEPGVMWDSRHQPCDLFLNPHDRRTNAKLRHRARPA